MRLGLLFFVVSLASCGRKPVPPPAPTAAALGTELATYRQVLVILSPITAENIQRVEAIKGPGHAETGDFQEVYAHADSTVAGSSVAVIIAYSGAWLLPRGVAARPMTPPQFLRAFANDEECGRAVLITPKGTIFIERAQHLEVLISMRNAGAVAADLPFSLIRGAAR